MISYIYMSIFCLVKDIIITIWALGGSTSSVSGGAINVDIPKVFEGFLGNFLAWHSWC